MGLSGDLKLKVNSMIYEMESDSEHSRSQEFLQEYWDLREELQEAIEATYGKEKIEIISTLNLLNRKAKENDVES